MGRVFAFGLAWFRFSPGLAWLVPSLGFWFGLAVASVLVFVFAWFGFGLSLASKVRHPRCVLNYRKG